MIVGVNVFVVEGFGLFGYVFINKVIDGLVVFDDKRYVVGVDF